MCRTRIKFLVPLIIATIVAGFLTPATGVKAIWRSRDGGHGFLVEQVCRDGIRFGFAAGFLEDYRLTFIADQNLRLWNGSGAVLASRTVTIPKVDPRVPADYGADDERFGGYTTYDHVAYFTLRWSQLLNSGTVLRMRIEEDPNAHDLADSIPDKDNRVTVRNCRLVNLALNMSDSPDPVVAGGRLTYTYNVTNLGSANAIANRTFASARLQSNPLQAKPITIADGNSASPYPSRVTVGGLAGRVTDVKVTLQNVIHDATADLDVLLVSPTGRAVMLMSDAGGEGSLGGTVTFDDTAEAKVPDSDTAISGARHQPANYGCDDRFPAPAPASHCYATTLSTFNGASPNGTWSLYVVDDTGGNRTSTSDQGILGGWALTVSTDRVPYRVTVQDRLPDGSAFLSYSGDGWRCTSDGQTSKPLVTCSRYIEAPQSVPALRINLRAPRTTGRLVNSASMTAVEMSTLLVRPDAVSDDATVTTRVTD